MSGFSMRARRPGMAAAVSVLLSLIPLSTGSAQSAHVAHDAGPSAELRRGPVDPAEIGAFLDGLMSAHMSQHGIAGASVAIVRDGELLFSRGYGWADVERRIPVDPARTLFRIGSVSKLFTWTAVMQQRDAGTLDLDADISRYLDFPIPATWPEPITLRHILTHTTGFEDRSFGLFAPPASVARGEWLRSNIPARVRPPGRHSAYSNYATALAAYIVERVSGSSWEEYVERAIMSPLAMEFATPRQPLPEPLARHLSRGYVERDGELVAQPFDWIAGPLAPAGSISASADAMAAFMIAHLQHGEYRGIRILADTTAREMHARAFGDHPRINGFALGFYEKSSHGLRIIGHDGGTQRFFTDLALIPAERLGIFVAYNSTGGAHLAGRRFLAAVLDHYYPGPPLDPPAPIDGWEVRARAFAGSYLPLRRAYTTFEKPVHATMSYQVDATAPGEIVLRSPKWVMRLREVEPGYFVSSDRGFAAAFHARPGEKMLLSLSAMAGMPLERQPAGGSMSFHASLLAAALLVIGSAFALIPLRFVLQRSRTRLAPLHGWERGLRWIALAFGVLAIGFVIAAAAAVGGTDRFLTGASRAGLRAALILPVVALPLAIALLAGAVLAVRRHYWSRWGRVHYAIFALAALVYLAQLHYWNLLGWKF